MKPLSEPDKYLLAKFLNWLAKYKDWEMVKTEVLLVEFERQRNQGQLQ